MLVTLAEILKDAEAKKYGVGMFNMLNLEMARGIIEAAEEEKSPLLLGLAEVHLQYIPFDYAALIMKDIAAKAKVPICLHFDHGVSFDAIQAAIDAGFTSVMYDGSSLPYEENIANSLKVCKMAHAKGVSVEAELGHVGGAEGGADDGVEEMYTKPSEVKDFLARSEVDALAVAIGTAHGLYKVKPVLDINRLAEIYAVSDKPLVLHGGSGLSDQDFRNTVANGIRKINICSEMCAAAKKAYTEAAGHEIMFTDAKNAVKNIVKARMQLFGSSGKA